MQQRVELFRNGFDHVDSVLEIVCCRTSRQEIPARSVNGSQVISTCAGDQHVYRSDSLPKALSLTERLFPTFASLDQQIDNVGIFHTLFHIQLLEIHNYAGSWI